MKLEEIIEILDDADITPSDFADSYDLNYFKTHGTLEQKEAMKRIGGIVEIASGLQDDYNAYTVVHFIDHDIYMKLVACYDSYESLQHYENWGKEVKPKEITATIYE